VLRASILFAAKPEYKKYEYERYKNDINQNEITSK
jgi:hypothetical protein